MTDDTAAIQAAIDASLGTVYFPPGVYLITSTVTLKSALAIKGQEGGGYAALTTHPSATQGASLVWGGAAGGTMVSACGCWYVSWDGVDLDGVDYAHHVTGFYLYSTNTPASTHLSWTRFRVFNCGVGMKVGAVSGATDYQTDHLTVRDFRFYQCRVGIQSLSENAFDFSAIAQGVAFVYDVGIDLQRAGYLTIDGFCCGSLMDNPTTGAFIAVGLTQPLHIRSCQGEGPYTGWTHLRALAVGANFESPITMEGCKVDEDVWIANNRQFISIGNSYGASDLIVDGPQASVISIGDYFDTGDIIGSGADKRVMRVGGYNTATGLGAGLFSTTERVGVGVAVPTVPLHVVETAAGADHGAVLIHNPDATAGTTASVTLRADDQNVLLRAIRRAANDGIDFAVVQDDAAGNPIERFRITEAGDVGIGTSDPTIKLQVLGGLLAGLNDALALAGGAAAYDSGVRLVFINAFGDAATQTWRMGEVGAKYYSGDGAYACALVFNTNTGSTQTSVTEKMRLTGLGRLGIGTIAPGTKLAVVGLPTYADEAAASSLQAGDFYKTATGALRIKL